MLYVRAMVERIWERVSDLFLWFLCLNCDLELYEPQGGVLDTVKPVVSVHSKINKTKILMTNGSLTQVKSIAECSVGACNAFFWPALSDNGNDNDTIFGLFWVTA